MEMIMATYMSDVKSPDSDVFQIITVLLGVGVGIKKRLIDINKLVEVYTNVYCSTNLDYMLSLGCDTFEEVAECATLGSGLSKIKKSQTF